VKLVIAGAGGHGKVVCDALLAGGFPPADIVGFVDDNRELTGRIVMGFPVLESLEAGRLDRSVRVALGIGGNSARRRQFERALALGYEPFTVVHPRAVVGGGCVLGRGVVAFANVVINPDTRIGDNVILNTGCSVDHDCRVGAHSHIGPGARLAGGVIVGEETLIGIGSSVVPGVSIGPGCVIGAGAAVIEDVEPGCVAVGVPARVVKRLGVGTRG
jgi:sugar O-acyltransferase (sialic acid O-acetyltransferase NeuD family)